MACLAMTERTGSGEEPEGLTFPCQYPVKVMSETGARTTILELVERHVEFCADQGVRTRPSRNGRFEAITVTVEAQSREQLERLYADLRQLDAVKMML
jgi:putative lipoic acid-binding regulatory protein